MATRNNLFDGSNTNLNMGSCDTHRKNGLTLIELLVVISIISILAALLLTGVSAAKAKSQSIYCRNNLRQISIAMSLYLTDNKHFPGSWWIHKDTGVDHYVWQERLVTQMSGSRKVFVCPSSRPGSAWDTNVNSSLGCELEDGEFDPFAVGWHSRFSIGYNDWGIGQAYLNDSEKPQLGLGGDINGPFFKGFITESMVASLSEMIMLGDTRDDGSWDGSIDPTESDQWPSSRHSRRCNLAFVDGHTESPLRKDVIDPSSNSKWRPRWNNDGKAHPEITWRVDPRDESSRY